MWSSFDCFLCCKKLINKSTNNGYELNNKELLHNKSAMNQENYQIRRVSRVAGTISLEDLKTGDIKHYEINKPKILVSKDKNDSGLWECPSETSLNKSLTDLKLPSSQKSLNKASTENLLTTLTRDDKIHAKKDKKGDNKDEKIHANKEDKPEKSSWHKALHSPVSSLSRGRRSPSLATSTPDLTTIAIYTPKSVSPSRGSEPGIWSKSQSMLDVSGNASAREFGLDPALYPTESRAVSTVTPHRDLHEPVSAGNSIKKDHDGTFTEMALGTIHFAASLNAGKLHVHVSHIEDLPVKGENRKFAATLRLVVLTNDHTSKGHVVTSKTARDSLSPCKFREDFEVPVASVDQHTTLRISVCDGALTGSKYDAVGHALFSLNQVELQSQPRSFRVKLYKQSQPSTLDSGLLQATLSYDQREHKLSLLALQCRDLNTTSQKTQDKYTTYVKASLYFKGHKLKSKKSSVIAHEKDPFHNHTFQFRVGSDTLPDSCLVVSVMLKSRLKSDVLIGRVIFGPNFYADGDNMTPWGRVVLGQQTASHWYRLYV